MEFLHPNMNMEFGEMDSSLGAFWSPAFENDSFNSTFVSSERGNLQMTPVHYIHLFIFYI